MRHRRLTALTTLLDTELISCSDKQEQSVFVVLLNLESVRSPSVPCAETSTLNVSNDDKITSPRARKGDRRPRSAILVNFTRVFAVEFILPHQWSVVRASWRTDINLTSTKITRHKRVGLVDSHLHAIMKQLSKEAEYVTSYHCVMYNLLV